MNQVLFPRLGWSIPVTETALTVFGIEIKWYAIIITTGIFLAWLYVEKNARKVGLHPDSVFDVLFGGIIGGVIGARLYYVLFEGNLSYYIQNPMEIFNTRAGGLAFYGGLIGGILIGALVAWRKKLNIFPLLDLVGPAFLIGQSIGRWGNFVNQEAFGANTTLPWGMTSDKIQLVLTNMKRNMGEAGASIDPTQTVHPCFLYESIWCAIGFFLLNSYRKNKRKFDGDVFLLYLAWYGFGRFFIEGLRMDSLYWGPFRVSQVLSLLLCVGALLIRFIILLKIKKDPAKYPLYKDTEKSKEIMAAVDAKVARGKKKADDLNNPEVSKAVEERNDMEIGEVLDLEEQIAEERALVVETLQVVLEEQETAITEEEKVVEITDGIRGEKADDVVEKD